MRTTRTILTPGLVIEADLTTGGRYVDSLYEGGETVRCRGRIEALESERESRAAYETGLRRWPHVYARYGSFEAYLASRRTVAVRWLDGPEAGRQYTIHAEPEANVFPVANVTVVE